MATTGTLDQRKRDLLIAVVREYVKTAVPVGSVTLAEKYGFDFSPATIRNELAALEEMGLIEQPHTSSGRIPSEEGFQTFVDHLLEARKNGERSALPKKLSVPEQDGPFEVIVKDIAKHIAEVAHEAVFVAFTPRHLYYTGISHLFNQPEFEEFGRMVHFSELIDRMDDILGGLFPSVEKDPAIWIGRKNPFGNQCGTVIGQCSFGADASGVMGILGPLRMDYERCLSLFEMGQQLLDETFAKQTY